VEIKGCIALVTGANRGLGRAYAEALLEAGAAKVYAGARDPGTITDPRLVPVRLDVTAPEDIAAAAAACGDVTLLINNAGAMLGSPVLAADSEAALRRELEVNVFGVLGMARSFAPVLASNGGGAIVNVLSVVSWFSSPFNATYCASKHAALAITEALRIQLRVQGTAVAGVYAGYIDTDMAAHITEAKVSPRRVAQQTLDGVRRGLHHIHADDASEELWQELRPGPDGVHAAMQALWDQANLQST
jgi:NAD(P)-dependent dehydrogenase (short-subunit alcohol dehydrogenase family)